MLTQNSTKPARPAPAGAKLVWYQSAGALRNRFTDHPARALNLRYWLRDALVSGSQWAMYQAYDSVSNRDCSVKMLGAAVKDTTTAERQLLHEADVLASLGHPNIAELYECSRDEQENLFSVMEPLQGRDLHSLLAEVSALPLDRTLEILRGVGAALQHAHERGFVHLDLNPHCVFLHEEYSGTVAAVEVVKVLNFGLAKPLTADKPDTQRNLHLDVIFDTPAYLAPEALELNRKAVDDRADQWSLAVLAYQMLSGQLPFRSDESWCLRALIRGPAVPEPLATLVPFLPPHVLAAIEKALSKDKNQRFGSVADFLRALDGQPVSTSRPTQPELRVDLIESCRPDRELRVATPTAPPTGTKTREYPAPSFPAELLAAVENASPRLPAPQLTPPWAGVEVTPQQRGGGAPLWLVLCILMALIPAVTVLHLLHPVARARALLHHPLPAAAQLTLSADPLPGDSASPALAPAATFIPHSGIHKHKHAHSHHGRARTAGKTAPTRLGQDAYRSQSHSQSVQDTLTAGLGL